METTTRFGFGRTAWTVLGLNVAVILGGSVVRATDSGAGCGETWPGCSGEGTAMVIEFTHRLTSALALAGVVLLFLWARRLFAADRPARIASRVALVLIIVEALIGAALVVFGWVEDDESVGRAIAVSVHLTNTFLLLGTLALTAWWGSGRPEPVAGAVKRMRWFFGAGAVSLLAIGMTGALNALGDTLFPAASLSEGFEADFAEGAHFLVRLRILHPLVAVAAGILVVVLAARMSEGATGVVRRAGTAVMILVGAQVFAGIANLLLLTPLASQLVHLFLADVLWIAFVVLGAAVAGERAAAPAPVP